MKETMGKTVGAAGKMAMAAAGRGKVFLPLLLLAFLLTGCGQGVKVTDTIRWMNGTHAVATAINGRDFHVFGLKSIDNDAMQKQQQYLKDSWEVTDQASAEESLRWLYEEGHHKAYGKEMEVLAEAGIAETAESERAAFVFEKFETTKEEAQLYADLYGAYEKSGGTAILAWDYSRAMALIEDSYIAGYYTETEALDKSLELAGRIQETYPSWDAFMEAYLTGYEYWSGESSQERRKIYDEIKGAEHSPYLLEWSMALEKSW